MLLKTREAVRPVRYLWRPVDQLPIPIHGYRVELFAFGTVIKHKRFIHEWNCCEQIGNRPGEAFPEFLVWDVVTAGRNPPHNSSRRQVGAFQTDEDKEDRIASLSSFPKKRQFGPLSVGEYRLSTEGGTSA